MMAKRKLSGACRFRLPPEAIATPGTFDAMDGGVDDQQRLASLKEALEARDGLDENQYARLIGELERPPDHLGVDASGRLKVAMFDAKSYENDPFDRENRDRFSIHRFPASLNVETAQLARGFKAICIFVNDRCDAEVIEILASLGVELIALRCAGFNNVDLEACAEAGISVVRVPAYSPYAVAEHTVGLMLTLNRRLHHAWNRNRSGYFVLDGLTGFDMYGKTAGVVGSGKIGVCTANILLGMGCRVLAYDKFPNPEFESREGVEYVELDRLFRESDIITLHLPLFPETHHVINADSIATMKNGVMLINTSRGGLVDANALIDGLKSRKIGSAGLDVYEEEAGIFFHNLSDDLIPDDVLARLMTFNNVIVTSHQAFLTREALANIASTTFDNLSEYLDGKRGSSLTNGVG